MKTSLKELLLIIFFSPSMGFASVETVKIPGGQLTPFWLAAISKKGDKSISLAGFESEVTQVTVKQFKSFLKSHPEWKKENVSNLFADEAYLENLNKPKLDPETPMTSVSWFAARAYCESNGMRLPTTNEWEYIATASQDQKDASSDPVFLQRILDWYSEPQGERLKKVKSVYRNLYGLWDLHGLVWEWVEDYNSNFVTGESREDSSFNKDMFCGAGGMAGANRENYAAFMRFAFRSSLKGRSSVWNLGFRCVR